VDAVEDGPGELARGQLAAGEELGRFVDGEIVKLQR
jgi:hypothetical protein